MVSIFARRCRGSHVCSQCKCTHYCSRAHQKEHWKAHKLQCGGAPNTATAATSSTSSSTTSSPSLFPEYSIEVEAEVFEEADAEELKGIMERANIWEDARE